MEDDDPTSTTYELRAMGLPGDEKYDLNDGVVELFIATLTAPTAIDVPSDGTHETQPQEVIGNGKLRSQASAIRNPSLMYGLTLKSYT